MRGLPFSCLLLVTACADFTQGFRRDAAMHQIVGLYAQGVDSKGAKIQEKGAGIVVATDDTNLYVATARHALLPGATNVQVRAALKPGVPADRPVVSPLTHNDPEHAADGFDLTLVRIHVGSAIPLGYKHLALIGSSPRPGDPLFIRGWHHGFENQSVGLAHYEAPASTVLNTSSMTVIPGDEAPTGGDSGGGVFDEEWGLVGLYLGAGDSRQFYNISDVDRWLQTGATGKRALYQLEPARRTPYILGWPLTTLGTLLLGGGIAVAVHAGNERDAYFRDPSQDQHVNRLNITADTLMITGTLVLGCQLVRFIAMNVDERSIRQSWGP